MADIFVFSGAGARASLDKCRRISPGRRRLLGMRTCSVDRMEILPECTCMARFITEPVFCDNLALLPFGIPAWQDGCLSDDDEEGGVPLSDGGETSSEAASCLSSHSEDATSDGGQSETTPLPVEAWMGFANQDTIEVDNNQALAATSHASLTLRLRHPRPECDETDRDEDARRQRIALPGNGPNEAPRFHEAVTGFHDIRSLSSHRSCDNLHNHDSYRARRPQLRARSQSTAVISASAQVHTVHATHEEAAPGENQDAESTPPATIHDPNDDDEPYDALSIGQAGWDLNDQRQSYDFADFIDDWVYDSCQAGSTSTSPSGLRDAGRLCEAATAACDVLRHEVMSGSCDVQGIPWQETASSRNDALRERSKFHPSHMSRSVAEAETKPAPTESTLSERHYRFHRYNSRWRPIWQHTELRDHVAAHGRNIYYSTVDGVARTPLGVPAESSVVMNLTRHSSSAAPMRITCLATSPTRVYPSYTGDSVVIAGGFYGEYALRSLDADLPTQHEGHVTHNWNGVVTHIHTFPKRSSGALEAAFCSNDTRLRIMDIRTLKWTSAFTYDDSLNCSATAPDGRLRVIGGDSREALITDAETGETLLTLKGQKDHIFACAWSPDSRHVATASQDGQTLLWDSRKWSQSLTSFTSSMTCARSLHFTDDSALLIAAENEDVVSIYDVRKAENEKQELRFFGTISGVALLEGGREMVVGNGDRSVGGLMCWRRDGSGSLPGKSEGLRGKREREECWLKRRGATEWGHEDGVVV